MRRITAENTGLRHLLMEMEARVAGLTTQVERLSKRVAQMRRLVVEPATSAEPKKPAQRAARGARTQPTSRSTG